MIPVAGVGFAASYDTLRRAAEDKGFSHDLSYWVPVGIDGAILAFLALDMYLTAGRIGWPLLRFAAHRMVLATIVFNAAGAKAGDPVAMAWHGLMPVLFVIGVEAVRRLILHATRLANGEVTDRIPLHRWLQAPAPTVRLYRRMRLAGVTSYPEMIRREQALDGYRVWLTPCKAVGGIPATDESGGFLCGQTSAISVLPAELTEAELEEIRLAEDKVGVRRTSPPLSLR
ncbi:DUF2637 domain-containing protein [Streptomyces sp. NPDC051636]|uniref:DUF2637 domain-containing protein n=1 Tax=Streptomyces sp. NPDC051636 TaxID=3365663 RepID=UPI0037A2C11D